MNLAKSNGIDFDFTATAESTFKNSLTIVSPVLWGNCTFSSELDINAKLTIEYANEKVAEAYGAALSVNYFMVHGSLDLEASMSSRSDTDKNNGGCDLEDSTDTCKSGGFEIDVSFPYPLPPPFAITVGPGS